MKRDLPVGLKIGPIQYAVVLEKKLTSSHDGEEVPLFGMVNFKHSRISIDRDLSPQMRWQCLWHEIIHVLYEQLGLDNSEGQVDGLAYKMLELLLDNGPALFPTLETQFEELPRAPFEGD